MDLIERGEQLRVLAELASEALNRRGSVVLIAGAAGTGRTALLQRTGEHMAESGALVLTANCAEAERSLNCGMVAQLLHSAPLPGQVLAGIAPVLDAATECVATNAPDHPELLHLLNTLCVQLQELASRQPLLIGIDDIHHADPVSLEFVQLLVRRLRSARILAMLTARADAGPRYSPFLADLHRQPHLAHINVAPLSRTGVAELLATHLGSQNGDRATSEYFAATGGNPLLLQALLTDRKGAIGNAERLPPRASAPTYRLALLSCLRGGQAQALHVARALAVLDDNATSERLAVLTGTDPERVTQALEMMSSTGLLDDGRFRHGAARAAVLDDTPAHLRPVLHEHAAQILHENGMQTLTVAEHLREAGSPPRWASSVLTEAAEHALASRQPQLSADYLELALRADPHPKEAAAIRARLVHSAWQLNPATVARHLDELVESMRAGHLSRRDVAALARHLLWHGRISDGAAALDRLRSTAEESADALVEVGAVERWLSYTYPQLARPRRPAATLRADNAVVAPLTDPWLQAGGMLAEALARGQGDQAADRARRVLRDLLLGRHTGWSDETVLIGTALLTTDERLDVADEWCFRLADTLGGQRTPTWQALVAAAHAEVAIARGDSAAARDLAQDALAHLPPKAWGVAIGLPIGSLIVAHLRMGRVDEAAALLARPVPEAIYTSRYGLHYLYARGNYHFAIRHYHAALADFLACGDLMRDWGLDVPGLPLWRVYAAEAWLRLGNYDQGSRLVRDQIARCGNAGGRARALSLRLLAGAGPASRRAQLLVESLELFEGCGDRYEQARTLADLARAYHGRGDNRRARMAFRRAVHLAKACQAEPLCRGLLSLNSELGDPPTAEGNAHPLGVLTESERRVASLAAIGYTNREIAGKLYVTPSTVEQHLTRVYRKLKIKHRRQLPMDLNRADESRPPAVAARRSA